MCFFLDEGDGVTTEAPISFVAVPNTTQQQRIVGTELHENHGYGDSEIATELAKSSISDNITNDFDDHFQILFANRRSDLGIEKDSYPILHIDRNSSSFNLPTHQTINKAPIFEFFQSKEKLRNNMRSSNTGAFKGDEVYGKNIELIVGQVVNEISPTIDGLIEDTVIKSNGDIKSYRLLLESILVETEPLALNVSIEALKHRQGYPIIEKDISNQVLSELRPILTEVIRNGIEQKNLEFTENDIVKIVRGKLKNNLHRIIKRVMNFEKVSKPSENKEKLIKSILKQLRLIANHAVRKTIKAIDVKGLNSTFLTNRIVHDLIPSVKIDINHQIDELKITSKSQQTTIIGSVIQNLWPDVIHFVQEGVREYKREPNKSNNLIDLVLSKLQPVIRRSVKEILDLPGNTNLNQEKLQMQITNEIRSLLQVGDIKEKEVFKPDHKSLLAEDILVQDMKI